MTERSPESGGRKSGVERRRPARRSRPDRAPRRRKQPHAVVKRFASLPRRTVLLAVEVAAWVVALLVAILAALPRLSLRIEAERLLPVPASFAVAVLVISLVVALAFRLWLFLRRVLQRATQVLPVAVAAAVAVWAAWFSRQPEFAADVADLRAVVGGRAEAERRSVSHQVFAAYRRSDLRELQRMLERARPYEEHVRAAAGAFGLDAEVLFGVAATESSFLPRDSKDGGRGLFQVTSPPQPALRAAAERIGVTAVDLRDARHNAFVAAATLREYLDQMKGDLFLGLLAYNIGPTNGGLRSIMQQYGARDFVTIQPYLQNLPRDYPIRVLSAALAYRIWRSTGRLLPYQEGENARFIQGVGVPGLGADEPGMALPQRHRPA